MTRIPMIAVQDFTWQGVSYTKDQRFDVRSIEAAALHYQKQARFLTRTDEPIESTIAPEPDPPAVEAAKEVVVKVRRPRRKRRDIARSPQMKAHA